MELGEATLNRQSSPTHPIDCTDKTTASSHQPCSIASSKRALQPSPAATRQKTLLDSSSLRAMVVGVGVVVGYGLRNTQIKWEHR